MTYILVKPDPPEGNTTRIATFMCEFQQILVAIN